MRRKLLWGLVWLVVLNWAVPATAQTCEDGLCQEGAGPRGSVRIVGGNVVRDPDAYPWMISVAAANVADLYAAHQCGATLISPTWALSAAHCFVDEKTGIVNDRYDVVLGTLSLKSPAPDTERIPIAEVFIHPKYDRVIDDNDIALLKLARSATRTPVESLATTAQDAAPGLMAKTMGWGWTQPQPRAFRSYPYDLMHLDLPLVANDVCARSMLSAESVVTENMLCAGTGFGGQDSCTGDSGGPLVRSLGAGGHMLVGVVSWGEGCAQPDSYGVYARVSRFVDWINFHVHGGLTMGQWVTSFYIAYWGRAADPGGLDYWLNEVHRGAIDVPGVAENFALSEEAKAMYPYFQAPKTATDVERTAFVQAVYANLLNRSVPVDDKGVQYWVEMLRTGQSSPGAVIGYMIYAAIQANATDWLTIWNKIQVGEYFTHRFEASGRVWQDSDLDLARQALDGVTDDPDTVGAGRSRVDLLLPQPGEGRGDTGPRLVSSPDQQQRDGSER
ncbi:MAG: DUF4214 domain-containing protein [Desulfovibrionales bacterium]|nr:MAG: DUF4214 domain-containing protein [Desulfovibrionales bacterium]